MVRTPWSDGGGPLPDTSRESAAWLLLIVVFLGVGLGWAVNDPGVWYSVQSSVSQLSFGGGGEDVDELYLPVEQAERLNTDYSDLNTVEGDSVGELGYCLSVGDDGRLKVQQAGTVESDEHSVTFVLSNCLPPITGTVHFHPPASSTALSDTDKQTLVDSPYEISCVQSGLVSTEPGTEAGNMRCYREPGSGDIEDEFPEIPVEIVE